MFCGSSASARVRRARHGGGARRPIGKGLIEVQPGSQVGKPAPGLREIRRALRDDLQHADVRSQLVRCVRLRAGAQVEVVDGRIDRAGRVARKRLIERPGDVLGDLVLDREDVFQAAVVAVGPERRPRRRLDQMRADAHAPRSAADRAVEHVGAVEALRRFGLAFAAKLEARRAADHLEVRPARQPLDDLLADAVREILHLGIARQVVERQHGEHRLDGATRLLRVGRPRQLDTPRLRDLTHFDGILDSVEAIVPMDRPTQRHSSWIPTAARRAKS